LTVIEQYKRCHPCLRTRMIVVMFPPPEPFVIHFSPVNTHKLCFPKLCFKVILFSARSSKWSPYLKHSYQNSVDKDEVFPVHPLKTCRRSRSKVPLILNLGTRCLCAVKLSSNHCCAATVVRDYTFTLVSRTEA
jgi:hypothetical protein